MRVSVSGAGIVGVMSALKLQQEGHQVTLIDKETPGSGCSFGNAGMLARSSFMPLSNASTVWQAPSWLLKANGPLKIDKRYLMSMLPWLYHYIKAGFSKDLTARAAAINQLTTNSVELYQPLAALAGCSELIKTTDYLQVYRNLKGFNKGALDMQARRALGYEIEDLDQQGLQQLEPALSTRFEYGHLIKKHAFVTDPQALVLAFFEYFKSLGGEFISGAVTAINAHQDHCQLSLGDETLNCDKAVVAAGAYSAKLIGKTSVKLPLETERGYHITCPEPQVSVGRPVMDGDNKFFVTPMDMGLRFAGMVEFAGLQAPAKEAYIQQMKDQAQEMLPGLNTADCTSWLGFRPTLYDSAPVISYGVNGQKQIQKNIIYAFGHQHVGLTAAPMTANLVSELIAEKASRVDSSAYDVQRFL